MSATAASQGVRVLRLKGRTAPNRHPLDVGLSAMVLGMGLFTGWWGLKVGLPLLWGFAPVGIINGASGLWYWLRPPQTKMHWWFEHMGAMIGSGIGTVTAFLVVNAKHVGINGMQLAVFLGPTVVGITGLKLWEYYYRRRFAGKTRAPAAPETVAAPTP
jgi:hypothetical protein